MKLYSYHTSSCSFRARIALNIKALDYEIIPVELRHDGGQNLTPEYVGVNPQGLVPALIDDEHTIAQSLAIIEYLEDKYPDIPLLPPLARDRAIVRSMAMSIVCDAQPLNNSGVIRYLRQDLHLDDEKIKRWYQHWIQRCFNSLEIQVLDYGGSYCFGDTITLADVCLIPQIYNAIRYECDMGAYPQLQKIYDTLILHPAFDAAKPESQADFA